MMAIAVLTFRISFAEKGSFHFWKIKVLLPIFQKKNNYNFLHILSVTATCSEHGLHRLYFYISFRSSLKAIVIDECHKVESWYVYHVMICLYCLFSEIDLVGCMNNFWINSTMSLEILYI